MAMAMSEREQLKTAYSSATWQEKVKKMSDAQVHAIYIKFKNQKKI